MFHPQTKLLHIDTQTGLVSRYVRPAPGLLRNTDIVQITEYQSFKPVNADELELFRKEGME